MSRGRPSSLSMSDEKEHHGDNEDQTATFGSTYHAPVMWKECIAGLQGCDRYQLRVNKDDKTENNPPHEPVVFVDGTLGGGGHSSAILQSLQPGDVLIGCDVDSDALKTASDRLANHLGSNHESLPLFVPVRSNFCELASVLPKLKHPITDQPILPDGLVDGILMDLGVSSYQIDTPERGFAFMKDGPLDMRMMNDRGLTAANLCNELDEKELERIMKTYGDEPRARAIAKSIFQRRPLHTTQDLVAAVADVTPEFAKQRRFGRTASLARVFQSFRIVVNEEDKVLDQALSEMCPNLLRPGGRLVVLSYHSMEDRATKRIMRDGTLKPTKQTYEKDLYGNLIGPPRPFRALGKARKATVEEVEVNPRARSAKLRIAERLKS